LEKIAAIIALSMTFATTEMSLMQSAPEPGAIDLEGL